jgi:peptidoglycan/xylan/chitin deacetylase (PgdA/CDA1 family)
MSCILWSIDPKDWRDRNSQLIVDRVLSYVKDGSVILLHDPYNTSVDAAFEIIDTLQAEGYKFVTVSDLAFVNGCALAAGQTYRNFP